MPEQDEVFTAKMMDSIENRDLAWAVYERVMDKDLKVIQGLSFWQAKAICAILNKGR